MNDTSRPSAHPLVGTVTPLARGFNWRHWEPETGRRLRRVGEPTGCPAPAHAGVRI